MLKCQWCFSMGTKVIECKCFPIPLPNQVVYINLALLLSLEILIQNPSLSVIKPK